MAELEIFFIADAHRLVNQSLIRDLNSANIKINLVSPDAEQVKYIPDDTVNIMVSFSDSINYNILIQLKAKALKFGAHIYFVGKKQGVSIDEEEVLKKIPAAYFDLPLDLKRLMQMMEWYSRKRKRILVVDDEPMILKSIKSWLEDQYEVYMVSSGLSALDFIIRHPVDLILLDYEMPGLTGPDVLNRIRFQNETKNLAVIFLTAKDDKSSVMNALEQKPDGYMLKRQTPQEIKTNINNFFKRYVVHF
ncbi:MAG: response regulator [Treponema sp.]|nr:response regulator [Treponema sp.]